MLLINMHLKSQKNLRGNHKPHVSKTLRLPIIKCLKNKASDKQNCTKQRNLVPKLNKQIKKEYFDNILKITLTLKIFGTSVSHISQISSMPVTIKFS